MGKVSDSLISKYRIISTQIKKDELEVLLDELENVLNNNVVGDVVELGCFEGTSALFEMRMILEVAPDKNLYLYDSFEGLPPKTNHDQSAAGDVFRQGVLKASKSKLKHNFVKAGLPLPEITKAWFYELELKDLPDRICFAFLDGDFYESIMDSLKLIYPKMEKGSVIVVDDYHNAQLPGVKKAIQEYFKDYDVNIEVKNSLAIIRL